MNAKQVALELWMANKSKSLNNHRFTWQRTVHQNQQEARTIMRAHSNWIWPNSHDLSLAIDENKIPERLLLEKGDGKNKLYFT